VSKVLFSFKFYWKYAYYRLINKYCKEINILPWTTIKFIKLKSKWYVKLGNRKVKLENVYNAKTVGAFMVKFGFISMSDHNTSIFKDGYLNFDTGYQKSDLPKMKLVQKLIDQRIKAAMDNTAKR